jgi:hypothetical protein
MDAKNKARLAALQARRDFLRGKLKRRASRETIIDLMEIEEQIDNEQRRLNEARGAESCV